LVFQILAAVAQWERSLIQERVRAGIARAKREGKRIGRPQEITAAVIKAIKEARKNGASFRDIADQFGVSTWSAHRACMA
jgi:putative DNA-invertase from lambdoid prophage Rac